MVADFFIWYYYNWRIIFESYGSKSGFQIISSLGNKLSGILAKMWDTYDDKANYFLVNFALLMFATLMLALMLKRLNKIFKEYGA